MFSQKYVVMSRRDPPFHDAGLFTEHQDLESAVDCAKQVSGTLFMVNKSELGLTVELVNLSALAKATQQDVRIVEANVAFA